MKILALRTDKPEAELYLHDGGKKLEEVKWEAHRELAETLHKQLAKLLDQSSISLNEVKGIVCYKGPGSFTGLRIGLTVANTLAYSQNIPVVATSGNDWLNAGIKMIEAGKNQRVAIPEYGAPANTTLPKK